MRGRIIAAAATLLLTAGFALCADVILHGDFFDGSVLMVLQPLVGVAAILIGLAALTFRTEGPRCGHLQD